MVEDITGPVLFESERLRYKDVEASDSAFLASLMLNPETMAYIPTKYEHETEILDMISRIEAERKTADRTVYFFMVIDKARNLPAGIVNLKRMTVDGVEQGILGYIIDPEYAGKGFATESTRNMVEYGFKTLSIPVISASTAVDNLGSERILKRLGMKEVGTVKDGVNINGKFYDEVKYELERAEYLSSIQK